MKPNSNPSISDELCWDFFVGGDFVLSIFRMEEQWYNLNNLIEEGGTHMIELSRPGCSVVKWTGGFVGRSRTRMSGGRGE